MVEVQFIDVGRKANQLTLDIQNKLLISIPTETTEGLNCVCSDTKNNIFAVGLSGTILKYDATQDKFVLHPQSGTITTNNLWYIDTSVGDGLAVGDKFTVLQYNSSTGVFSFHTINGYDTNIRLFGVMPFRTIYGALYDIYIGRDMSNNHGVIYIYDGITVTKVVDTDKGAIHSLFTLDAKNYIAVGLGGGIFKSIDYGATWTEIETGLTDSFYAAYGLSYDEIWIGTLEGKIYKYNFYTDELKLIASGYPQITCIGGSAKNDLYAVGAAGLLLHYDGNRWEQLPSGTVVGFNYITVVEENKIYVVGVNGTAYRFYGKAYPSVLIDNVGDIIGIISKPLHSAIKGYYPASGDYRPIAVNASGELSIHTTVSGEIVRAEISGEVVKSEQYGTWGVQVSGAVIVSGDLTVSGQPVDIIVPTDIITNSIATVGAISGGVILTSADCISVIVKALSTNSGDIYIGGYTAGNMPFSGYGLLLEAGDAINIDIDNVGKIHAFATVSGDKVTYIANR